MKSIAALCDWLGAGQLSDPEPRGPEPPDYRLRALPREEIDVYVKQIDNAKVVRLADKKDWWASVSATGIALLCSLLVSALAVPSCYSLMASRRVEFLRQERSALQSQLLDLRSQESRRLSPDAMEESARGRFIEPRADSVFYAPPSKESVARLGSAPNEAQ